VKEQIISKAYAQALVELSEEQKLDLAAELTTLTEAINQNNNLETVLFLDVFTIEEKWSVLEAVAIKLGLSATMKNFLHFLIQEKRLGFLPMIFKNVIVIDDHKKGFLRGTIEGNEEQISEEVKNKLKIYLQKKLGKEAVLTYIQNDSVTAGYRVTVEDLQLDASIDHQLENFKESVLNS
jgi:F-type H+-transporting ATPase subunit delta